jgi:hypothetical protein
MFIPIKIFVELDAKKCEWTSIRVEFLGRKPDWYLESIQSYHWEIINLIKNSTLLIMGSNEIGR